MARPKWLERAETAQVDQAAAIPYRVLGPGQLEVLLVTSTRTGRWTLPKGGIKVGSTPAETAAIEALEEAGVAGRIEESIGDFAFEKQGDLLCARVFPLRVHTVLERWEEEQRRLRAWVPIAEVARFVRRRALVELVVALRHRVLAGVSSGRRARVA